MVLNLHVQDALTCDTGGDILHHYSPALGMPGRRVVSAFFLGVGEGGPDVGLPPVNDPEDPATWTDEYKRNSQPVQEVVDKMREDIKNTQDEWRGSFIKFDDSYHQVHDVNTKRMVTWEKKRTKLQRACENLRDSLDRLLSAKTMCAQMQDDELPHMFTIKGTEPKRFRRFGDIKGCVRQDAETGEFAPITCECIAGNEQTGCGDAVGLTGNTLSCTHILEEELPKLPMAEFFDNGGACSIHSHDAWSDAIISKDAFKDPEGTTQAAISPLLTSALSVLPQCTAMHQRADPCLRSSCSKAGSKACHWSSFLVNVDEKQ